jgi:retinol dehydrogenase-12
MKDKICLITGANSGIGKATARALAAQGATVVLVCRSLERGDAARQEIVQATGNEAVSVLRADMGSQADIAQMAQAFLTRFPKLDVLVNNAGLYLPNRSLTADGYESMFGINHLGYYLTTHLLAPALLASPAARVVNVSSDAHRVGRLDFDDLQAERSFKPMRQYGTTKLANILFTRALAKRLPPNVTTNSLHPGVVATEFAQDEPGLLATLARIGRIFLLTPEKGARTSIFLASSPTVEGVSGQYFVRCKPKTPSKVARDDAFAQQLWDVTAAMTNVDAFSAAP